MAIVLLVSSLRVWKPDLVSSEVWSSCAALSAVCCSFFRNPDGRGVRRSCDQVLSSLPSLVGARVRARARARVRVRARGTGTGRARVRVRVLVAQPGGDAVLLLDSLHPLLKVLAPLLRRARELPDRWVTQELLLVVVRGTHLDVTLGTLGGLGLGLARHAPLERAL